VVNRDTRQNPQSLMLVEVFVDVENGHELKALKTKLWKYGFIRREEYDYGRDKWRRPTVTRARPVHSGCTHHSKAGFQSHASQPTNKVKNNLRRVQLYLNTLKHIQWRIFLGPPILIPFTG